MKHMIVILAVIVSMVTDAGLADTAQYRVIDRTKNPQLYCLALNIYFEARGESVEGQYAVADVTLNRVESSQFPNTVCDVVYQCRRQDTCQFSWVHQVKNPQQPRIREPQAWHDAQLYAVEIAKWDIMRGVTEGATYFHADYSQPYWRHQFEKTTKIGSHLFYRDPSGS
jgi:N-acetylmuramoyl-L-alanine amidase